MDNHQERITFDVITLAGYNVVLEIPWLQLWNPQIDWQKEKLIFPDQYAITKQLLDPTVLDQDESTNSAIQEYPRQQIRRFARRKPDSARHVWVKPVYQNINATSDPKPEDEIKTDFKEEIKFPKQYNNFKQLFKENVDTALSDHQLWNHKIRLKEGKKPTFGPIYLLLEFELKTLKEYINFNLQKGYIRLSKSPAGYPVLFAPKKNGKLQLCVDYRQLNKITIKNQHALPLISELQNRIYKARIFSKIDLRDGFHQIRMKEGEQWKTAFRCRYGHYKYQVMPFRLTNVPASLQALLNNTLHKFLDDFMVVYLDNILVYSKNEEEHERHVQQVLTKLWKKRLLVNAEKCTWHVIKVEYFRHFVSHKGI